METILSFVLLYFNLLYYKTISFFTEPQTPSYQVIFKADDLREPQKSTKKLDKIIKKENIKISWGIIGKSLESPSREYLSFLEEKKADKNYHFFNHGYRHYCDHNADDKSEFTVSVEEQIKSLQKTQDVVKDKSGIVLNTFGAPCNYINGNTTIALKNIKEIKYWYFGFPNNMNTNIPRFANIEKTVGNPDLKFFQKSLEKLAPQSKQIVTLQIHPYMWDSLDFLQFEVCIAYLKSLGVEFITPDDLNSNK